MSVKYAPYRLMAAVIVAGFLAFPGPVRAPGGATGEAGERDCLAPDPAPGI